MSIPKGLIVYRAARHQNPYPANFKYRCCSNKLSISREVPKESWRRVVQPRPQMNIMKIAKITKFIRYFDLSIDLDHLEETQIMRYFSKLHHIKKCFIHVHRENRFGETSKDLAINLLKRTFRTLKELEQVHLNDLWKLQKDFSTFKNLLLQRSLQKLLVSPLECTQEIKDVTPFLKLSQAAHRRKCWPHLKSLRVDLESYEMYIEDIEARRNVAGLDSNLLKFLQDFRKCESLYKCSHFHFMMPEEESSNRSAEEYAAFDEILKMGFPIKEISVHQGAHIESLFEAAQHMKNLKSVDLQLADGVSENIEMNSLKKFPNLQEMSLVVDCENSYEGNFSFLVLEKIQSITHLKNLSLYFDGDPGDVADLLRKALSKLTDLTHLTLQFPNMIAFEDRYKDYDDGSKLSWAWLKKAFQEVGKMKKLKYFYLEFENFNFRGASGIFKSLCQALGELTQLSSLCLKIEEAEAIKDKDMLILASSLARLTMIETLNISFGSTKLKPVTFAVLMDSIIKNLRILSEFDLKIRCSDVTKQCYQAIEEGIRQMKYLNKMKLEVGGTIGRGVNMGLLNAEVKKKMTGEVYAPGY